MELKEILNSGILELYVLGQLSRAEIEQVESYVQTYPELREEIKAIAGAFETIGNTVSQPTSPAIKKKILQVATRNKTSATSTSWRTMALTLISAAAMAAVLFLWYGQRQNNFLLNQEINRLQASCDSIQTSTQQRLALYQELNHPENDILAFEATPNFENTKLYFHTNQNTAKNFIQVLDLPDIGAGKTFQLWSLRDGQDPMPLDLFDGKSELVEVDYIQGTTAYAITIEEAGGSEVPNLDQLIGIVSLAG